MGVFRPRPIAPPGGAGVAHPPPNLSVHLGHALIQSPFPCLSGRRKKLRFHPRQLYLSVKQGELQKVVLMLRECSGQVQAWEGLPVVPGTNPWGGLSLVWAARAWIPPFQGVA